VDRPRSQDAAHGAVAAASPVATAAPFPTWGRRMSAIRGPGFLGDQSLDQVGRGVVAGVVDEDELAAGPLGVQKVDELLSELVEARLLVVERHDETEAERFVSGLVAVVLAVGAHPRPTPLFGLLAPASGPRNSATVSRSQLPCSREYRAKRTLQG
jgi:hypothetical protein